ncbi:hypothetical protein [Rhodopila sp.]|uniref:hypothetical protein n=1 Tax=Rhodopila sp. TaxID=2480087 RepID=UPI003D139654
MSEEGDKAIERALSRRREILEELKQIDTFVTLYRKYAGAGVDTTSLDPNQIQSSPTNEASFSGTVSGITARITAENPAPKGMRQHEFVSFVKEMLIKHGRPMQAHEILDSFHEKGRHVGGSNETSNLKTKLWRAKMEITTIPGSGYWPLDLACPAVSYYPPHNAAKDVA